MNYPIPELFKSAVLSQYLQKIEYSAACELEQIALQAQLGQKLLEAVLQQARNGYADLLCLIPIPKRLKAEDGWEFKFDHEESLYISADGYEIELKRVLELMLLSPEERADDMFPQFQVTEWKP